MTFETLDWSLEAKRFALAFGVDGECEISCVDDLIHFKGEVGKFQLFTQYSTQSTYRFYAILTLKPDWKGADCSFSDAAFFEGSSNHSAYALSLAHGIFHLGLLTDEVEAALGIRISQHERLEWSLEHEARMSA